MNHLTTSPNPCPTTSQHADDLLKYYNQLTFQSKVTQLSKQIADIEYWWVENSTQKALYNSKDNKFWLMPVASKPLSENLVQAMLNSSTHFLGLTGWRLPSEIAFMSFRHKIRSKKTHENIVEFFYDLRECWYQYSPLKIKSLAIEDDEIIYTDINKSLLYLECTNPTTDDNSFEQFITHALAHNWRMYSIEDESTDILASWSEFPKINMMDLLHEIDYRRCRLPKISTEDVSTCDRGLWEFYGAENLPANLRARNPLNDINYQNVTIDFGTSSTVVALQNNGRAELLRVGARDYFAAMQPEDYENPTVLELIDLKAVLQHWQHTAYQPNICWDDVRCSHEALSDLRNNATDPQKVSSILAKIKQWALREGDTDEQVVITDQKNNHEYRLPHLTLRNPVKGTPLHVSDHDPFDPVELYAYFLGLYINWRNRGIFLNYHLTFPVAYARDKKDKILASFRRGLQRSLPATMVNQAAFADFSVEERASEPLAYAVGAMLEYGIEPTEEGLAYAVFDFGGGTADFAYGIYRLPTVEEEQHGIEEVFEHWGAEGDRFLGGENLLENLAYRVFIQNEDICRSQQITFSCPLDEAKRPGMEMLIQPTQTALTNTLVLMSRLRSFWEAGERQSSGVIKLDLINNDGQKHNCELSVNYDELQEYLENRIQRGIINFFIAMHNTFKENIPEKINILLAGNASKSRIVLDAFGLSNDNESIKAKPGEKINTNEAQLITSCFAQNQIEEVFIEKCPEIICYAPLPMDKNNPYRPTAKTGVALGLLRLCPGEPVEIINKTHSEDEAPFAFYVGKAQRNVFKPMLRRGAKYQEWVEIGIAREGVFPMYYSSEPTSALGQTPIANEEVRSRQVRLAGKEASVKVFARAISPNSIEICSAESIHQVESGAVENRQIITLA